MSAESVAAPLLFYAVCVTGPRARTEASADLRARTGDAPYDDWYMPRAEAGALGTQWYARFGDIPGVNYVTPPGIDRTKLKAAGARPSVSRFQDQDGTTVETLSWDTPGGPTSASPAHELTFGVELKKKTTAKLLLYLYELLELPGEPSDYHFAIQNVIEELWRRRRDDPGVLADIESLSWLNIQFIQAHPATVKDEYSDEPSFYAVRAFARLLSLYEREGAWRDALAVAELGAQYGQPGPTDALLERIAALDAEALDG